MARLWLDEEFATHPKLLALGTRDNRWTWLELLVYTCKYGGAEVPAGIRDVIPKATAAFLRKCVAVGLLDESDSGLWVHDWHEYQGTVEERVTAFLTRNPAASANEVQQAVAGKREAVLGAVKRFRENHPDPLPGGSRVPDDPVPKVVPSVSGSALEVLTMDSGRHSDTESLLETISPENEFLVAKLMRAIGDHADVGTRLIVASYAVKLPPASLAKVAESLVLNLPQDRAAYAVAALKGELAERSAA